MKIIAWFSCGITSAVACKIAVDTYGDAVELYYIEIDSAHPDNERFIKECETWYGLDIKRVRSDKYKDQFDVIEKTRFINGPHGAKCTGVLKKDVRREVEAMGFDSQVFGFEYSPKEINRAVRFQEQHPHTSPSFPLIDRKLTKEMCADILLMNGIQLPAMYEMGYHNNNCCGCVKGGMGYWNKIRFDFPEVFLRMSELEQEIGRSCIKEVFLKDLEPTQGRHEPPILPDCGTFCEIEFADLISPKVEQVVNSGLKVGQLSFFGGGL